MWYLLYVYLVPCQHASVLLFGVFYSPLSFDDES